MESGVVNQESLSFFLRRLEEQSVEGVLELTYPERGLELWLSNGKLIEIVIIVDGMSINPAQEVLARLEHGGFIPSGIVEVPEYTSNECYAALWESCAKQGVSLSREMYLRAIRHRLLDRFYELDLDAVGIYHFRPLRMDSRGGFDVEVPVSDLLLDMVALQADSERFRSAFHPEAILGRADTAVSPHSEEEEELLSALSGDITVETLRWKSLLNRLAFEDAVLSLYERGAVVVRNQLPEVEAVVGTALGSVDEASAVIAEVKHEVQAAPPPKRKVRPKKRFSAGEWLTSTDIPVQVGAIVFLIAALALPVYLWIPALLAF